MVNYILVDIFAFWFFFYLLSIIYPFNLQNMDDKNVKHIRALDEFTSPIIVTYIFLFLQLDIAWFFVVTGPIKTLKNFALARLIFDAFFLLIYEIREHIFLRNFNKV